MSQAEILYAKHAGVQFYKLRGDLRQVAVGNFASSLALNEAVERLLREQAAAGVLVDLREAEAMDSTHLGLVAHIGAISLEKFGEKAQVLSTQPHITRLLTAMGLEAVLEIVATADPAPLDLTPLQAPPPVPGDHAALVLRAHQELAKLSEDNANQFRALIALLGEQGKA